MSDKTKDLYLFIFIILTIIGFIFAFNGSIKAGKNQKLFENEMAFRLDMEEAVGKLRNERMNLTMTLKDKDLEIKRRNEKIANLANIISEQESKINTLKSELEKEGLLKNKLEDNLKEELSKQINRTK